MRETSVADLPRSVLDNLLEGVQLIGPDYRYLYVNDAVVQHGRTTREALLGRTMMEAYPGIDQAPFFPRLQRCMQTRQPDAMENEFTYPDGQIGWFELRFEPTPQGVAILSIDITERKRAEAATRRYHRALSVLSDSNQTLVRATDERRFMQDVCEIVVGKGGYQAARIEIEAHGEPPVERSRDAGSTSTTTRLVLPFGHEGERLGTLYIHASEPEAFDPDERTLLDELALDLGYGVAMLRGRAERTRLQELLARSQRLEAVGRLAGGVAHDFNNLLTVIQAYADFSTIDLEEGHPVRDHIDTIRVAVQRASDLTRQLLAFSRKQVLEPRVLDPNEVVHSIATMLRRILGEDIRIEEHLAERIGRVRVDPGQLEQVILNMALNARDAMPRGGRLTLGTQDTEIPAGVLQEQPPGSYVQITIRDTGTGMDPQTRVRIFEPFFTTKAPGEGTGLGLATAWGIVAQSGGEILVESAPGRGTAFGILLPRIEGSIDPATAAESGDSARGHETVLLVEDDPVVRELTEQILARAGYRVISAACGEDALAIVERGEESIDLLLTDVVMPGMSGVELAHRLQDRIPAHRVLLMSGYAEEILNPDSAIDPAWQRLDKPFGVARLERRLRAMLDLG